MSAVYCVHLLNRKIVMTVVNEPGVLSVIIPTFFGYLSSLCVLTLFLYV